MTRVPNWITRLWQIYCCEREFAVINCGTSVFAEIVLVVLKTKPALLNWLTLMSSRWGHTLPNIIASILCIGHMWLSSCDTSDCAEEAVLVIVFPDMKLEAMWSRYLRQTTNRLSKSLQTLACFLSTSSAKRFGSGAYCIVRNMWHYARLSHARDSKDNNKDGLLTDECCGETPIPKANHVLCQNFSNDL